MQKGIIVSLVLVILSGIAIGQVPLLINYQGLLMDPATGQPIPDGAYTIVFSIYDVPGGGIAIWEEAHAVETKNGLYSVMLGSVTLLTTTILSGPEKYLGIKVGSDPEMTPRKRIVSVAFAILSEDADKLDGKDATEFADAAHNHDDRYYTETELNTSDGNPPNQGSNRLSWDNLKDMPEGFADGVDNTGGGGGWLDDGTMVRLETSTDNVGIGTATPTAKLDIVGGDAKINELTIGKGSGNKYSNSAFGYEALYSNTTAIANTAIGAYALRFNTTGLQNTAIGCDALYFNTTGSYNTANGYLALYSNTSGMDNTANGFGALYVNTQGNGNIAIGNHALCLNTDGSYNTAIGLESLYSNTQGNCNTAIGWQALHSNTWGVYNTAVGDHALYQSTSGKWNTAIGYNTLYSNTTQNYNTAIGCHAGYYASSDGTFIGDYAYSYPDGYSNVTALGNETRSTASNQVRIGNSSVTSIGGQVGWTSLSDGRYKLAVAENVKGLDFIMKLHPVTYQLDVNRLAADLKEGQRMDENGNITIESSAIDIKARIEKSQIVYTGFVGQEVEQAAKEIGYDFSGVDAPKNENDFYGLRYAEFVVPLVKAVQEQQKIIEDLRNEITALKKRLGE